VIWRKATIFVNRVARLKLLTLWWVFETVQSTSWKVRQARFSLRFTILLVPFFLLAIWWSADTKQDRLLSSLAYQTPSLLDTKVKVPTFTESALARGISFEHRQNTVGLSSFIDTFGGGVCVFDVNDDGWMDVFLVGGSGTRRHHGKAAWWANESANRLFINNGVRFVDQTETFDLAESELASIGCAIADLDQDGDQDLVVFGEGGVVGYRREAKKFVRAVLLELANDRIATGVTFLDVDRDNRLDLYITTLVKYQPGKNVLERFSGFAADQQVSFNPGLYDASANVLLINAGDLAFRDETSRYGVANAQGRSLGATASDLNKDGWLDLIVLNDFGTPNSVFINQQGTAFSRSISSSSDGGLLPLALPGSRAAARLNQSWIFSRAEGFHPALLVVQNERWEDNSRQSGLGAAGLIASSSWGVAVADLNLDGSMDVALANGKLEPDEDAPLSAAGQPNWLLLGSTEQQFVVQTISEGNQRYSSRGIVTTDINNDGDIDLLVANNNGRFQLFENTVNDSAENSWISFDLGVLQTDLSSVLLTVRAANGFVVQRHPDFAQGFLSQSDQRIHVALPMGTNAVSVEVVWSDGSMTKVDSVEAGQIYRVAQATGFERQKTTLPISDLDLQDLSDLELIEVAKVAARTRDVELIELLWQTEVPVAQVVLLDGLEPLRDIVSNRVVQLGLAHPSEYVQLAGISFAAKLELDGSIDWLMPLLSGSDTVSCATSRLFVHFFDEEEIAIRRKYLAIKSLLKVADQRGDAAVCAINALAAAEKKRALPLLHNLIANDSNTAIVAAAVRAIGLIRDTVSLPLIRELITRSEDPSVLASASVALVRLGASKEQPSQMSQKSIGLQLRWMAAIADSADAAVIGQVNISQWIRALVPKVNSSTSEAALMMAIAASADREFLAVVKDAKNRDSLGFSRALSALEQQIPLAALNLPAADLNLLLTLEPNAAVTPELLIKLLDAGVSRDLLANRLHTMNRSSLSKTLALLVRRSDVDVKYWMEACSTSRIAPIDLTTARALLSNDSRLLEYDHSIPCLLYGNKADTRRKIANRILIKRREQALAMGDTERNEFRMRLGSFDDFYVMNPLQLEPSLRGAYLLGIGHRKPASAEAKVLFGWASDERSDRLVRLQALSELARLDTVVSQQSLRKIL
jgi:hypothetical protein